MDYNDLVPPNDKELEKIILGCFLLDKYQVNKYIYQLTSQVFFFDDNKLIFESICDLHNTNRGIDIVTVAQNLREKNLIDSIGGLSYLATLTSRLASAENLEIYIRKVQEYYLKRNILDVSTKFIQKAFDNQTDAFDLISDMKTELEMSISDVVKHDISSIREIHIENIKDSLRVEKEGISSGINTGLRAVDNLTNGWQKSDLIILAGRPSMGKTAAAINMAIAPAIHENKAVLIFSLEMSKNQLVGRIESMLSEIDVSRIIKKQLSKDEIVKMDNDCQALYNAPVYIDDTAGISLPELKAKARKLYEEKNIELIVIDYFQLMKSGLKIGNREQEIAEISRGLKTLAKELNVPVIALSQLSRVVETRQDKKPILSDLRESGQIEQDADMVVFCYRPEYYGIDTYELDNMQFDSKGLFMLIWAKHRNGELGEIPLKFLHSYTKIENYEKPSFAASLKPNTSFVDVPDDYHPF